MKILDVSSLALPEIRILKTQRFRDNRGYFIEAFRSDVFNGIAQLPELQSKTLTQINESYSETNVVRGLHTQVDPALDKMLRVLKGRIIDIALDIRPSSPTYGKAIAYELFYDPQAETEEWIFIPFGFAHGFVVLETAHVQYYQTGLWNAQGESCITIFDSQIDWSLCSPELVTSIQAGMNQAIISDKDKAGITLAAWKTHPLAVNYKTT